MSASWRPIAVLDANVLYSAPLRDLLIRLAIDGQYQARWTGRILDECFDNLLANRPDLNAVALARTRDLLGRAVRAAAVTGYEHRAHELTLPDPDDVHVLAAALHADATVIVTANLADFPDAILSPLGIEAIGPDRFVARLVAQDWEGVMDIIERQAAALASPPMTASDVLDALARNGMSDTVDALRAQLEIDVPES